VDGADIGEIFIPRKPILQRILMRPYDVAIDLNLDFVLHAAYICKASRAPFRVGIMREHGDSFFNVQIKLNRTASPQAVYEKLTRCLEMF
jgi:hypothetical protein